MAENASAKKPGFFTRVKNFFTGIVKYFRDVRGEMKKVVWPTRKQVINNTITVLVVVLICAVIILLLDFAFGGLMSLLLGA